MDSSFKEGNQNNSTNAVGHTGIVDVHNILIFIEFS
jgi:hypothetical protein